MAIEVTPRCKYTFARNRLKPGTPKERSSSFVVSKRFRCSSVSTLYASCCVRLGVSGGCCMGVMEPSIRTWGGTPAEICRSEALNLIISSNSWRSETMGSLRGGAAVLVPGVVAVHAALSLEEAALLQIGLGQPQLPDHLRMELDLVLA